MSLHTIMCCWTLLRATHKLLNTQIHTFVYNSCVSIDFAGAATEGRYDCVVLEGEVVSNISWLLPSTHSVLVKGLIAI